jgi:hypothetical protein
MKANDLRAVFQLNSEYVIDKIEHNEGEILIHCHSKKKGIWHEEVYSQTVSERRIRKIQHIMIEDRKTFLVLTQRRFRFHELNTCRWEQFSDIGWNCSTTKQFQQNTLRELQRDNYSGTGKKRGEVGCM